MALAGWECWWQMNILHTVTKDNNGKTERKWTPSKWYGSKRASEKEGEKKAITKTSTTEMAKGNFT